MCVPVPTALGKNISFPLSGVEGGCEVLNWSPLHDKHAFLVTDYLFFPLCRYEYF